MHTDTAMSAPSTSRSFQRHLPLLFLVLALGCSQTARWESYRDAGDAAFRDGQYGEAERLIRTALDGAKTSGANDASVAMTLNVLGVVYAKQQRYPEAEAALQEAIARFERSIGAVHAYGAATFNSLGVVHVLQGKYKAAETDFWRAVTVSEAVFGKSGPQVASPLHGLAVLYTLQGWYRSAELLYQREMAIYATSLGPKDPHMAMSLTGLAVLHTIHGDYDVAESLFKQSLSIIETAQGADHPSLVPTLEGYAELLRRMKREKDAQLADTRALTIRAKKQTLPREQLAQTESDPLKMNLVGEVPATR
jgi:tetratricopeptide (TPR) repeat protein